MISVSLTTFYVVSFLPYKMKYVILSILNVNILKILVSENTVHFTPDNKFRVNTLFRASRFQISVRILSKLIFFSGFT
jgi:hypothetical protein